MLSEDQLLIESVLYLYILPGLTPPATEIATINLSYIA